jgi:hypothetical protein
MSKRKGTKDDHTHTNHSVPDERTTLRQKRFKTPDVSEMVDATDAAVDYDDSADAGNSNALSGNLTSKEHEPIREGGLDDQRTRILEALRGWCRSNITPDGDDDSEVAERSEALAEVGMLLVFEHEKYGDSSSMKAELADIESIIGGDHVVTKFINFLLSLQNQVKKAQAIAAAKEAKKSAPVPAQQTPVGPMSSIPMHLRPAAQPVLFTKPFNPHAQPWQNQGQPHQSFPGYSSHSIGTVTKKKESEFEMKKNQILAECTEHLKVLIEKGSKASDPKEKATILELIKKVKSRMDSLKNASGSSVSGSPGTFKSQ